MTDLDKRMTDLERSNYLDELNRKVARLAGKWREVPKEKWDLYFRPVPTGMNELWIQATDNSIQCRGCPPDYARSVDQAIELLEGVRSWEMGTDDAALTGFVCNIYNHATQINFTERAATPSEAICKAFIKYKEGEKK